MEEIALLPVQGWAIVDCVESLKIACSYENDLQWDRPRSRCKAAWSHTVYANSRLIVFVSILVIIVKWKQYFSEEETIKSKWIFRSNELSLRHSTETPSRVRFSIFNFLFSFSTFFLTFEMTLVFVTSAAGFPFSDMHSNSISRSSVVTMESPWVIRGGSGDTSTVSFA